jgi:hypothetical protein
MFTITRIVAVAGLLLTGTVAANALAVVGNFSTPVSELPTITTAESGIVVAVNPQPLPPRRRPR